MDSSLPAELADLSAQLNQWRQSHRKRARIPDHFYQAAVRLLDHCSVSTICRETRLRPASLRKHAAAQRLTAAAPARSPQPEAFFQFNVADLSPLPLSPPANARPTEQSPPSPAPRLLLERPDGARLTLSLPLSDWERIEALCQSFLRASSDASARATDEDPLGSCAGGFPQRRGCARRPVQSAP